jgi:hypothetical protein
MAKYLVFFLLSIAVIGCWPFDTCGTDGNVNNATLTDTAFVKVNSDSIVVWIDPDRHFYPSTDSIIVDVQNISSLKDSILITAKIKGEYLPYAKIKSYHRSEWSNDTLRFTIDCSSAGNVIVAGRSSQLQNKQNSQLPQCTPVPETFYLQEVHVIAPENVHVNLLVR